MVEDTCHTHPTSSRLVTTMQQLKKPDNGAAITAPIPNRTAINLSQCCLLFMALCLSNTAWALEFRCDAPGDIRYLRVDIPGQERLCEVSVRYEATSERRVMWYADNDTMFCSAKAYELRDKYENQWGFDCNLWPDRDGIDNLSPTHRGILDIRLKSLVEQGQIASPAYTVTAVRAKASTPLDGLPSALAIQYFLSNGDVTEVIMDQGNNWTVFATLDNLATHVTGDVPVSSALINAITDSGALEVRTVITSDTRQPCLGNQVLSVEADNRVRARTPHRYLCNPALSAENDPG